VDCFKKKYEITQNAKHFVALLTSVERAILGVLGIPDSSRVENEPSNFTSSLQKFI
jgi:hypothetical protein